MFCGVGWEVEGAVGALSGSLSIYICVCKHVHNATYLSICIYLYLIRHVVWCQVRGWEVEGAVGALSGSLSLTHRYYHITLPGQ